MTNNIYKKERVDNKIRDLIAELYSSDILEDQQVLYYQNIFSDRNSSNYKITIDIAPHRIDLDVTNITRSYMLKNNLTVTSFADMLQIGRVALSNFLNRKSALSFKLAESLSSYLNIQAKTLLKIDVQRRYEIYKNNK